MLVVGGPLGAFWAPLGAYDGAQMVPLVLESWALGRLKIDDLVWVSDPRVFPKPLGRKPTPNHRFFDARVPNFPRISFCPMYVYPPPP